MIQNPTLNYKDVLDSFHQEVNGNNFYPDLEENDRIDKELELLYDAMTVVIREMRLDIFNDQIKQLTLSVSNSKASVPADMNRTRADLGVVSIELDGVDYELTDKLIESKSYFEQIKNNNLYAHAKYIYIDRNKESIFLHGISEIKLKYLPLFEIPTHSNYNSTNFPLPHPHNQTVIQLAATHANAVYNGDIEGSDNNKMMAALYGGSNG